MPPLLHFSRVNPSQTLNFILTCLSIRWIAALHCWKRALEVSLKIKEFGNIFIFSIMIPSLKPQTHGRCHLFGRKEWWEKTIQINKTPATHKLVSEWEAKLFSQLHRWKQTEFDFLVPGSFVSFRHSWSRQNQCSKCYLVGCKGEVPCLLLSVFINTLLRRQFGP